MLRQALLVLALLSATAMPGLAADTSLFDQGQKFLQQGQYAKAVSSLEQYTRLQPEDLKGLQALAEAYLQMNHPDLAEVTLNTAQNLDRSNASTHFLRGRLRLAQKDYLRARSEFRTVIYLKAETGELWYYLAQTYQALKESQEASQALDQGMALSASQPDTMARLLLLQAEWHPKDTEKLLTKAMALKGLSPSLKSDLQTMQTSLLLKTGRIQELLKQQMQALEKTLGSNEAESLRLLNEAETWLGKSKHLADDWNFYLSQLETLDNKKPSPLLHKQLIRLYQRQGQYEKLQVMYQGELLEKGAGMSDKELALTYHRLADVYLKQHFLDFAFDNYERASTSNPHDTEALKRMGALYLVAQKPGDALKLFQRVQQELPLDRENLLFISLTHALLHQDEEARQLLAAVSEKVRPEVRTRIEAFLASEQRQADENIWRLLIPEEQILGDV